MAFHHLSGDSGTTRLYSGDVISKNSERLECLGNLDELNSLLGVVRHHIFDQGLRKKVIDLQKALFIVGAELATTSKSLSTLSRHVDEKFLDSWIKKVDTLKGQTRLPTDFIVPGETVSGAYLDLARSVSRRLERSVVALYESGDMTNLLLLVWLNRLSYYLYLLARKTEALPKK